MAQLTEQQKEAIVQALARFKRPAAVVAMMRDEFDVDVNIRQVIGYDPSRPAFDAADKWREIFQAYRKAFLDDVRSVPIANQAFRLHSLQEIHDKAMIQGNCILAAQMLELAAKEVGGLLTNARSLNLDEKKSSIHDMTPEERRDAVKRILRDALESGRIQALPRTH